MSIELVHQARSRRRRKWAGRNSGGVPWRVPSYPIGKINYLVAKLLIKQLSSKKPENRDSDTPPEVI